MASEEAKEADKVTINPESIDFGVIAVGFLYKLKFSVQNNDTTPMRMRVTCQPMKGARNSIRLINLPDIVAPGLSTHLELELSAEFVTTSQFIISVAQNHSSTVYTKIVNSNIVTAQTFKHVKKSLILQKRPVYHLNVSVIGNIPFWDTMGDDLPTHSSTATFNEAALMDDEDLEDLFSLPLAPNVYWDPFSKCLRLDPILGKVQVDPQYTLEEGKERTKMGRDMRLADLEEQGFLTVGMIDTMRADKIQENSRMSRSVSPVSHGGSHMRPFTQGTDGYGRGEEADQLRADELEQDDMFDSVDQVDPTHTGGTQDENEDDEGEDADNRREDDEEEDDFAFGIAEGVEETGEEDGSQSNLSSPSRLKTGTSTASNSRIMSVSSLLAMKRDKLERQRKQSIMISTSFSDASKKDTMVDKQRTLTMIKNRSGGALALSPKSAVA